MMSFYERKNGYALVLLTIFYSLLTLLSGCTDQIAPTDTYLVLYAFNAEGQLLKSKMDIQVSDTLMGRPVYIGTLAGKDIILAESGIGMTNAAMNTQKYLDYYEPAYIVFTGIAGAIDTGVHIGDIAVCDAWIAHDYGYIGKQGFRPGTITVYDAKHDSMMEASRFFADSLMLVHALEIDPVALSLHPVGNHSPKLIVGGNGVTGNTFIDSREKRQWLQENFSPLVTDMESAAVGQVCTANGLPFIIFRSASDLAGGSGSETASSELQEFFNVAAENSSQVVVEFLSKL